MKYFRAIYKNICRVNDIIVEAHESGLEFTLGQFFYDPQNKMYNEEFRKKFLEENRKHTWEMVSMKEFNGKVYSREGTIATILYMLRHPIKMLKVGISIERGDMYRA